MGDLKKPEYVANDPTTIKMQTSTMNIKQVLTIVTNYLLAAGTQVIPDDVRPLRIRIPRVVHCDDCSEFRVLQRFEPNSVCWKCDTCVQ